MSYITNKEDIVNFAMSNGYKTKQKGEELEFQYCPYCNGGQHKDEHTFSINTISGAYICQRASCGAKGHFVQLCRDFNYQLDFGESKKTYREFKYSYKKPIKNPKAVEYFAKRGISADTINRFGINDSKQYRDYIVIPFYDDKGKMQMVKFRCINYKADDKRAKEFSVKDSKPILFGMHQCQTQAGRQLVITEGQIDALTVAECGIVNVVSVPTGAGGFTWVEFCKQWVTDNFDEIIVFGDCERGTVSLVKKMSVYFKGMIKSVRPIDYLGEKDANDILLKYGKQAVLDCIDKAEVPKIPRIIPLNSVEPVNIEKLPRMKTGIRTLDKEIKGLFYGQLICLNGRRGEGKSTLASQFVAEAIDQNIKTLVYSGELLNFHFRNWLDRQLAGVEEITDEIATRLNDWYDGRSYIFDSSDTDDEGESLLELIESALRQYAVKFVLVDNLMIALEDAELSSDLYRLQSKFVGKLKKLAMQYNAIIVLVTHSRKGGEDGNDDVSGTADITNKADLVIQYRRARNTEDIADGVLKVTKNRLTGRLIEHLDLYYHESSKRITETGNEISKQYGWNQIPKAFETFTAEDLPF